jgi:hypothetical protein
LLGRKATIPRPKLAPHVVAVVRVIDRPQLAHGFLVPLSSTVNSLSSVSNGFSFAAAGAPPASRKCVITVARYHYI